MLLCCAGGCYYCCCCSLLYGQVKLEFRENIVQIGWLVQKKHKNRKNKSIRARDICEKLDYMASFRPVVNATAYHSHQFYVAVLSLPLSKTKPNRWFCVYLYVSRHEVFSIKKKKYTAKRVGENLFKIDRVRCNLFVRAEKKIISFCLFKFVSLVEICKLQFIHKPIAVTDYEKLCSEIVYSLRFSLTRAEKKCVCILGDK